MCKNLASQDNEERRISYSKYEKLKNDYFEVFEEKKILETKLQELESLKVSYQELINENLISSEKIKNLNENNSSLTNEISILKERFKTMSSENSNLLIYVKSLKENMCKNDKEKGAFKQKATILNSKLKLHEERTDTLKKKCFDLSNQLKQITDLKTDLENTIYKYEKEKPLLVKEALFSEENSLEFKYNRQTNFIEIFVENIKIAEYENKAGENTNNFLMKKKLTPIKTTPIQECNNKLSEKNSNKNSIVKHFSINDNKENESLSLNKLFSTPSKKNSPNVGNNNQLFLEKINWITDFNYEDDDNNDMANNEKGKKSEMNSRSKYYSSAFRFKNVLTTHRSRHKKIISLEEDFDENEPSDNQGKSNKNLVFSNQKDQTFKGSDSEIDEFPLKLTFSENINKFESKILKLCHLNIENPVSLEYGCLKKNGKRENNIEKRDEFSIGKEDCIIVKLKGNLQIDNKVTLNIDSKPLSSKKYSSTQSYFNILPYKKLKNEEKTNTDFINFKHKDNYPLTHSPFNKRQESYDNPFQAYE